jgi:outer membrane autotransporter protein
VVPLYRAEVPLFAALPAQLRQSDLAMLGNLQRRVGELNTNTAGTGDRASRQAWARLVSSDIDIAQQGTVSPVSKGHVNGFQAGTDLLAASNWRAGLYVGQLDGDARVSGFARGVVGQVGSTDLRSQYLGAYATWAPESGFYADIAVQAARHNFSAYPSLNTPAGGKGRSLLASVEVGQSFPLAAGWAIEPQLQLVHQRMDLDDVRIAGATTVRQDADNGWLVRAGLRVKGELATGIGSLQPYGRVNIYKRSAGTDIASFIGPAATTGIASRTGGTSAELAAGASLQVSAIWSAYGEIGKLWATGGEQRSASSVQGSLGVRAKW